MSRGAVMEAPPSRDPAEDDDSLPQLGSLAHIPGRTLLEKIRAIEGADLDEVRALADQLHQQAEQDRRDLLRRSAFMDREYLRQLARSPEHNEQLEEIEGHLEALASDFRTVATTIRRAASVPAPETRPAEPSIPRPQITTQGPATTDQLSRLKDLRRELGITGSSDLRQISRGKAADLIQSAEQEIRSRATRATG